MKKSFIQKCINETLLGLREGLSLFSGQSSAAVIYALPGDTHYSIYDPDSLLRGHELKLKNFYFDDSGRTIMQQYNGSKSGFKNIERAPELQIDGLLSFGGSSSTVPYQMWFTEHHPDLSSTGPTERWLEHTVLRFSHDMANEEDLYTGISGSFLKEFSTHAIHNHIQEETVKITGTHTTLLIYQILDSILGISKTREEGAWPVGELLFVEPESTDELYFLAKFTQSELPQLGHFKHVRKLLQTVEGTSHKLISDGSNILGISQNILPLFSLSAEFCGRFGFLKLNNKVICSFSDGRFQSSSMKAKLFEVEEALLDYNLETEVRNNLFHIISTLVHSGQSMRHGCTFVLDLNKTPTRIAGQLLEKPLDLREIELLDLACAFSRVDGALHICSDQHLHSFACLLDGQSIEGEDRARGARYNSALRFTAENPNTLVIVVSADRPVSVVQNGIVFHGQCQWKSTTCRSLSPETLDHWLSVSS